KELEALKGSEEFSKFTKKETAKMEKKISKLQKIFNGIRDMSRIPEAVFIVDIHREMIAANEAKRLSIPIIGIADTNANPDFADYLIPGNDDAIRAIKLILSIMADAVVEGKKAHDEKTGADKTGTADGENITEETFSAAGDIPVIGAEAPVLEKTGEEADISI
ncbi:MAG TPA: 30S ribosomal protein S2, partial [bacterium]|nr:30S ribosomal protein S2 [bacterium]